MDQEIVRALIACGADRLVGEHATLGTALHRLAGEGHHRAVEALARAGADLEAEDSCGETPLMAAVQVGRKAMVGLLLRLGASPRGCAPGSGTLMHHWTRSPDADILRLLLDAGAEVDAVDDTGETALSALVRESASLVRLRSPRLAAQVAPFLESLEISLELPERTPEDLARAVRALAAAGADVNRRNYGQTPLMEAADAGDLEMVRALLDLGADTGLRDDAGRTAADLADRAEHREVQALLRKA